MAKSVQRSTYAKIIGEIAIEWNRLEIDMKQVGFGYLRGDPEVASHIFSAMGNVSLTDFIWWLCEKREHQKSVRDHVAHFIRTFHILRENRNILEHAIPDFSIIHPRYLGTVRKTDRRGVLQPFGASIETLQTILNDTKAARRYSKLVDMAVWGTQVKADDPHSVQRIARIAASMRKPPLPRKIGPLPSPAAPPT